MSIERPETITARVKFEAFLCRMCPFCIVARKWPTSRFAARMAKMEASCRFCKAWRKVHGKS